MACPVCIATIVLGAIAAIIAYFRAKFTTLTKNKEKGAQ